MKPRERIRAGAGAQHLVDDGYTILHMGDFNNLGFSAFYSMEKMTIFK